MKTRDLYIFFIASSFLVGVYVGYSFKNRPYIEHDLGAYRSPNILDCVTNLEKQVLKDNVNLNSRKEANDICTNLSYRQGELNDFLIRRVKFFQQQYDETIMLWMVVIITFSGIVLAGLQLAASYQLASASKLSEIASDNDLTVARGKLVVKSSVTGLMILIVSFGFFLVFVFEIYAIKEVKTDANRLSDINSSKAGQGRYVDKGGLGPSPTANPLKN